MQGRDHKAGDSSETGFDRASFARAYRASYATLVLLARAQGAGDEADDVVQKAAIVALDRLDRFEPGTNFRAWMAAIVRGVARNDRRGRRRRETRIQKLALATTLDHDPHASSDVLRTENPRVHPPKIDETPSGPGESGSGGIRVDLPVHFNADLRNALESLGPVQAACLVLRAVHGHSYDEISAMLDIPAATARSHVFRARAALVSKLTQGTGGASEHRTKGGF